MKMLKRELLKSRNSVNGEIMSEFFGALMVIAMFFFLIFSLYEMIHRDQKLVNGGPGVGGLLNFNSASISDFLPSQGGPNYEVLQSEEGKRLMIDVLDDQNLAKGMGSAVGVPDEFLRTPGRFSDAAAERENFERLGQP